MERKTKKCPKCGEIENLNMERCMNGNTICRGCGYKNKHSEFYESKIEGTLLFTDSYDKKKKIIEHKDYISVKGGDGTMLRAVNKYRGKSKPFFGISAGTLNFLLNGENTPDVEKAKIKKFSLIKINIKYKYELDNIGGLTTVNAEKNYEAFNDIMIGGNMNSFIDFDIQDKDSVIGQFKGGGVIISTSQGSTGINKANGGVILPLSSDMWSVTGDKCNRKIKAVIEPKATTINFTSRQPVTVWVDGQQEIIENVVSAKISKGSKVELIFNDYEAFKSKRSH